jgi:hypothetical protein
MVADEEVGLDEGIFMWGGRIRWGVEQEVNGQKRLRRYVLVVTAE